jgi:glycerophosphoryl diester phosphodiesterase
MRLALACVTLLILSSVQPAPPRKQLVAHRGASAYAPEHTIAAYTLAIDQGADFVEQDLALTKDGLPICLHDETLERTTDVEERFPDRYTQESPPGKAAVKRWYAADFTLAEIKTLDAGTWFDPRFAGARIVTFQDRPGAGQGRHLPRVEGARAVPLARHTDGADRRRGARA